MALLWSGVRQVSRSPKIPNWFEKSSQIRTHDCKTQHRKSCCWLLMLIPWDIRWVTAERLSDAWVLYTWWLPVYKRLVQVVTQLMRNSEGIQRKLYSSQLCRSGCVGETCWHDAQKTSQVTVSRAPWDQLYGNITLLWGWSTCCSEGNHLLRKLPE